MTPCGSNSGARQADQRLERHAFASHEQRSHDAIRVVCCGAGVVMQPLMSRYCTTVPIRP
jgi:hypothetical protein